MNRFVFCLAALTLAALACSQTAARAVISASQPPNPQPTRTNEPPATPAGVACVVTAQALNIRACAGVGCAVIGWLRAGQAVTVATMAPSGWVNLTAGGWIHSSYLLCKGQ